MDQHDIKRHILPAFATPLINCVWSDVESMNAALSELILETEQKETGIVRSNVGGWHSSTDFLSGNADCIKHLRGKLSQFITELNRQVLRPAMTEKADQFTFEGWANVLRYGGYNSVHNHPNAYWSGVYYVNRNDAVDKHPFSGKLELLDPRPGASLSYSDNTTLYGRFLLNPLGGQIIAFPAWLQHQVHPYFGEKERISIAFNAIVEG